MSKENDVINKVAEEFNDMVRFYIHDDESQHTPILKHKDVQVVGDKIYKLCLGNPDLIPAFEHELSTYGYVFGWLKDDIAPYDTFMVFINTPYGMVNLYTKPNAFEGIAKEIDANRDLIKRHQAAEAAGDVAEVEKVKKEFARRLRRKQILYFLISPLHVLLLGIRGFLRLFKR